MRTDELIEWLARGAGAAPRQLVARRIGAACGFGLVVSVVLALGLMGPLPAWMFETPAPWMKLAYTGLLALAAAWLAARAARPGARLASPIRALALVVGGMAAGALAFTATFTSPESRLAALMGQTWLSCPWNVLALSLPALAIGFWAMRGLAPTRPRQAGFAVGALAGALGAMGYSLICPEIAPAFVATWYTLGVALTAALGAALGRRLLHW
ncbi:DUF1109 domain-containing protein [Ramlibacter sp. AW1]|uniref:DUF1109 domain-containing protein n=1 Tax=Ramlibacter aurantiacus TaxID=2801330 RepID=A0A936ZF48_9BURK|nr:DUF1109 domain-containing protein [Ramlibacter aurantiacus]MBL0418742.1 DUF1109 domain-containing protein [Ramlibacter aurantiacus]